MEFSEDLVQFYPNRITVSPRRINDWQSALERKAGLITARNNFKQKKKSVNLSKSSKKNIRDSLFSMYQLSKPRTVKSVSGKFIYNFRQSFVTLTIPAKQRHTDIELKACLNAFLTNLRRAFKIQNYVWKAELQKNANIHFHISFDKYVHYQAIRYYWLLAIKPLGYVDDYARKFSNMSLSQYAAYRKLTVEEASAAYGQGVRSNWQSPNCVDVSSVTTEASVSNYLSKYFAKSDDSEVDEERIQAFGKVWARSQSLSRLQYRNKFTWQQIKQFINQIVAMKAAKRVVYDYSTVFYINFKRLSGIHLKFFVKIIKANASRYSYPMPVP
jgi:hypothetical protein